jgi:hypothetical protein
VAELESDALTLRQSDRVLTALEQMEGAYERLYTLIPQLIPWNGEFLHFSHVGPHRCVCACVCAPLFFFFFPLSDCEVAAMKAHFKERNEDPIFNDNHSFRVQYPFNVDQLPAIARPRVEQLERFLKLALPFCAPSNWVCLVSKEGCERQESHSDYHRGVIDMATGNGRHAAAYPYACKSAVCLLHDVP